MSSLVFRPTGWIFLLSVATCMPAMTDGRLEPAGKQHELIPLALGNQWSYRIFYYAEDGEPQGSVERKEVVRGIFDFPAGRFFQVGTLEEGNWYTNSDGDVLRIPVAWNARARAPRAVGSAMPLFKRAKAGEGFVSKVDAAGQPIERTTLIEIDTEVETAAGKFRCFVYDLHDAVSGGRLQQISVAPGVGVVERVFYDPHTGILLSISDLVQYKTNGPAPIAQVPDKGQ